MDAQAYHSPAECGGNRGGIAGADCGGEPCEMLDDDAGLEFSVRARGVPF